MADDVHHLQTAVNFVLAHQQEQDAKARKRIWKNAPKAQSMTQGPCFEKLKNLYSSDAGQGYGDFSTPQDRPYYMNLPSPISLKNIGARTTSFRDPKLLTAYGFPTIHPHYPHHHHEKKNVRMQAGVPGQFFGSERNEILENDKLVTPKQHL